MCPAFRASCLYHSCHVNTYTLCLAVDKHRMPGGPPSFRNRLFRLGGVVKKPLILAIGQRFSDTKKRGDDHVVLQCSCLLFYCNGDPISIDIGIICSNPAGFEILLLHTSPFPFSV